jgi:hypothetical protein
MSLTTRTPKRKTAGKLQPQNDSKPQPRAKCHAPKADPVIASGKAYVDTIVMLYRDLPAGLMAELYAVLGFNQRHRVEDGLADKRTGRRVVPGTVKDSNGRRWWRTVTIHQPAPEILELLDKRGGVLGGAHIAYDFRSGIAGVEMLAEYFRQNIRLNWQQNENMVDVLSSTYWSFAKQDRNLLLYDDLPTKLFVRYGKVVHLELRFQTAESLRREGFNKPSDLIAIDPRKLFDKHVKLTNFTEFVERDISASNNPFRLQRFHRQQHQFRVQRCVKRLRRLRIKLESRNDLLSIGNGLHWPVRSGQHDRKTGKRMSIKQAYNDYLEGYVDFSSLRPITVRHFASIVSNSVDQACQRTCQSRLHPDAGLKRKQTVA